MSPGAFKLFLDFLIDKRVLNTYSHKYVVANGMRTASAVAQSLGNITSIAKHQYPSEVLLSNCISRAQF